MKKKEKKKVKKRKRKKKKGKEKGITHINLQKVRKEGNKEKTAMSLKETNKAACKWIQHKILTFLQERNKEELAFQKER